MFKKPIYHAIKEYIDNDPVVFHMPGHKLKGNISEYKDLLRLDITEIPGSDNLADPREAIEMSQQMTAKTFGSDCTFYSVNGSTLGIHAAIRTVCKKGDVVIVQRDSHKSVIAGLFMAEAKPAYIFPEINDEYGICKPITLEQVKEAFEKNKDAKAVIITSPSYYGLCCDIKEIVEYVHSIDKIIIVDEAHGAHFAFSNLLPPTANCFGADIVIQSAHKTLPAPTQTAYIHVNGNNISKEKIKYNINLLQTTSPSYMLLAGLDIASSYMKEYGEKSLEKVIGYINEFKKEITKLGYGVLENDDITRLVIKTSDRKITGYDAEKILREKYNIQVEMSDLNNIVCISTVVDQKKDFDALYAALKEMRGNSDIDFYTFKFVESEVKDGVCLDDFESLNYEKAEGRICADYIIPYPPGVPMLSPREVINIKHIELIKGILSHGGRIVGVGKNNEIKVVKISF